LAVLNAGDKIWLYGDDKRFKLAVLRLIAGIPFRLIYDELTISENKERPFISPTIGLMPQSTLEQNITLRGVNFGLKGRKLKSFNMEIIEQMDSTILKKELYKLTTEELAKFHLVTLSKFRSTVFYVNNWIQSTNRTLNSEIIELYRSIVENSTITISSVENRWLMKDISTLEINIDDLKNEYNKWTLSSLF